MANYGFHEKKSITIQKLNPIDSKTDFTNLFAKLYIVYIRFLKKFINNNKVKFMNE